MSKFSDRLIYLEGLFRLQGLDRSGNRVLNIHEKNMIVVGSREALSFLVSDPTRDEKVIDTVGIGTSGLAATPNDIALTAPFTTVIDSYEYPEYGKVQFNWSVGYGEANGMEIREFGLLCNDGTLFARKVRDVITKHDDLSLVGEWTLVF